MGIFARLCDKVFIKATRKDVCCNAIPDRNPVFGPEKVPSCRKTYDCKICHRSFNKQYNLLIHERSHHKDENQTLFNCNICGKAFKKAENMKNHRLSHSPTPIHKTLKGFLVECVTY